MPLLISSRRTFLLCLLVLAALVPGAAVLEADVIYSNFGTDSTFSAGTGLIVTNDGSAWSSVAVGFVPASDYNLTSIEFVATNLIPGDSLLTIGIFADNGGQPAGQPVSPPLESFTILSPWQFGDEAPVMTVTSLLRPLLVANTQYWIGMQGPVDGFIIWNQNIVNAAGFSETDGSGNWSASDQAQGVVEIDGALAPFSGPVVTLTEDAPALTPEPGAWWLMACGLAAITFLCRRDHSRF